MTGKPIDLETAKQNIRKILGDFPISFNFTAIEFPPEKEIEHHASWRLLEPLPPIAKWISRGARFISRRKPNKYLNLISEMAPFGAGFGFDKVLYSFSKRHPFFLKAYTSNLVPGFLNYYISGNRNFSEILIENKNKFSDTGFGRLLYEDSLKTSHDSFDNFFKTSGRYTLYANSRAFFSLIDICILLDLDLAFDKKEFRRKLETKEFFLLALTIEPCLLKSEFGLFILKNTLDLSTEEDVNKLGNSLRRHLRSRTKTQEVNSNFGSKAAHIILKRAFFVMSVLASDSMHVIDDKSLLEICASYQMCQDDMELSTFQNTRREIFTKFTR